MQSLRFIKNTAFQIGVFLVTAAICVHPTDILMDNAILAPNPPAGTLVGNFSINDQQGAVFTLSDSGDFINQGEFSIPSELDCTGQVSATGGVSTSEGVCTTIHSVNNQLFYIEGAQLRTSGALAFSDLKTIYVGVKGTYALGSLQKFFAISFSQTHPLEESSDLGNGWNESAWFGIYYQPLDSSWVYHSEMGWLYVAKTAASEGIKVWKENLGWLWTQDTLFPVLFSFELSEWLYFNADQASAQFYNFGTTEWF